MQNIWNHMIEKTNNLKLRKKLLLLYCGCVLFPLILTDSIILGIIWREERAKTHVEMKNIAEAVWYDLDTMLSEAAATTNKIYINPHTNDFLEKSYKSGLDYYKASYSFMKGTLTGLSSDSTNIFFYTDNDTIVNGGHFFKIDSCKNEEWYKELSASGQESVLCFYYAGDRQLSVTAQRKISFIRKLNYYKNSQVEKVVKYDMDYNSAVRKLVGMKYTMPIYVCLGDRILLSNSSMSGYTNNFETLTGEEEIGYEKSGNLYGQTIRVLVEEPESTFGKKLQEEWPLIFFMLSLNMIAVSFNDGLDAVRGGIYLWPRKWTLENYITVLKKQNLITGAYISVLRTVVGTVTALAANAILAFIVSRKRFLFKSQLSLFWVVTMYVNGGMIPIFLLYKGLNLTNSFWVYVIPGMVSAFNMLVFRTYMQGLPDSLEESAQLDGAGYMTIFIKIISPLCKPVYATIALFIAVYQWNSWFDAMLYNRMSDQFTTLQYELMKLLSSVMQQSGSADAAKNAANSITPSSIRAAATVVTMLPIVSLYPFLQRYFVTGLTIGGVKE